MAFVLHRVVGSRTVVDRVEGEALRIGRGTNVDLRFEDTAVGLEHAMVRREGDGWALYDLGSVTGTYLNGERVDTGRLSDGDQVGIGGYLLSVRSTDPEDPLFLHVRSAEAAPRPGAPPPPAPTADYTRAYGLRRGRLNKAFLALVVAAAGAAVLLALPLTEQLGAFQPGELTEVHATVAGADCAACHAPWRGTPDDRCADCHGPGTSAAAPAHHPGEVAVEVPCVDCHGEHGGRDALFQVASADCVACHGNLELAGGGRATYATSIHAFAVDHPQFALSLPLAVVGAGGGGETGGGGLGGGAGPGGLAPAVAVARRLSLDDPAARAADPGTLPFEHDYHLRPRLVSPDGPVQLDCADCHRLDPSGRSPTGMLPVAFEASCERCHRLTFDAQFARDVTAPHEEPERVRGHLYRVYQDERRVPGARLNPAEVREVKAAERRLYEIHCTDCHRMDLDAEPYATVEPVRQVARWLPHARFPHADHAAIGLACTDCHARAAESERAADVLVPGIETCTPCHRGEGAPRVATPAASASPIPAERVRPAPAGCLTCHGYHESGT